MRRGSGTALGLLAEAAEAAPLQAVSWALAAFLVTRTERLRRPRVCLERGEDVPQPGARLPGAKGHGPVLHLHRGAGCPAAEAVAATAARGAVRGRLAREWKCRGAAHFSLCLLPGLHAAQGWEGRGHVGPFRLLLLYAVPELGQLGVPTTHCALSAPSPV